MQVVEEKGMVTPTAVVTVLLGRGVGTVMRMRMKMMTTAAAVITDLYRCCCCCCVLFRRC